MAARGASAAGGDAGRWISPSWSTRRACASDRGVPQRLERDRLCRRPERGDRVSVGQQSNGSPAGTGGRSGAAPGGRYRHPIQHAGCARRQGCHREHSDRVWCRHRSGASGSSAELQPAGRERHRYRPAKLGAWTKAPWVLASAVAARRAFCRARSPRQSGCGRAVHQRGRDGGCGSWEADRNSHRPQQSRH